MTTYIAHYAERVLREKATQPVFESQEEFDEAVAESQRELTQYPRRLKEYPADWLTPEDDGREMVEGRDFELKKCGCIIGSDCPFQTGKWLSPCLTAVPIPPDLDTPGEEGGAYLDEDDEAAEDKRIMYRAKTDALISEWFDKWCEDTKRGGGALITTSIKELLTDFYNFLNPTNR